MTGLTRKEIAQRLLSAAGQGDIAAVEPMIRDDFVLEQMVRDPSGTASSDGTRYDRKSYLGFLETVKQLTQSGMNLDLELLIEDGDHVIVFGTSDAVAPGGWRYRNAYCWHLEFNGAQVKIMREYFDTALATRLLQESASAAAAS